MPDSLIPEAQLQELLQQHQPRFVPVEGSSPGVSDVPAYTVEAGKVEDPSQGMMQLRLSNGIRINARRTLNEPKAAMLRMVAAGMILTTVPSYRLWHVCLARLSACMLALCLQVALPSRACSFLPPEPSLSALHVLILCQPGAV